MTEISRLLAGVEMCACGRSHACPVECVEIGPDVTGRMAEILRDYRKILLVADENTYRVCGAQVEKNLGETVCARCVYATSGGLLIPDEAAVARLEGSLFPGCELILGVGSGVINDLCKFVSHRSGLPYYIFATAPSMDGFASVGAALILRGMKITENARAPKGILADTRVLAASPLRMRQAGWGDIIGKYSCLNDWRLSAELLGEYFCPEVYALMLACVERVRPLAAGVRRGEESAVAALMEALVIAGIAMSWVGNSRPASGSEHHLSHYFEITGILQGTEYLPHGIDVLCSAVLTAELREKMRGATPKKKQLPDWRAEIRRIYGTSAEGILDLQKKTGLYESNADFPADWSHIRNILADAPGAEEMLALLSEIGLSMAEFETLYGRDHIADGLMYAKDLKDRYTCLWLWYKYFA
ncbi:MAG: sn-glycerol-1-phosphate dehydrogenase [Clostridia bacterium]|nr:sn-glycerol-1-phosphate dehydrogenase [Clostridia bacterium]